MLIKKILKCLILLFNIYYFAKVINALMIKTTDPTNFETIAFIILKIM